MVGNAPRSSLTFVLPHYCPDLLPVTCTGLTLLWKKGMASNQRCGQWYQDRSHGTMPLLETQSLDLWFSYYGIYRQQSRHKVNHRVFLWIAVAVALLSSVETVGLLIKKVQQSATCKVP